MQQPPNTKIEFNEEFSQALKIMESTGCHVFITGRAGTGKSTLLDYFRNTTKKQVAVLAPTGVAAVNVGGQTIHSFFKFKPDITIGKVKKTKWDAELYSGIDAILIDEASMVRADLLDCVDKFLRLNARKKNTPFGGVQMIFIGDLHQLAPVVSGRDAGNPLELYDSPYFFDSKSFRKINPEFVELQKIYRQKDDRFIGLLNAIRINRTNDADFRLLNTRVSAVSQPAADSGFVTLTTTNKAAEEVNAMQLEQLPGKCFSYKGAVKGNFDRAGLPTEIDLRLKVGARVMLLNNDADLRWVNGTMGTIGHCDGSGGIEVAIDNGEKERVIPYKWDCFNYFFNEKTRFVDSKVVGSFTQYPLKLAWAVTIHKSQGKTFDRVFIDLGAGTFAPGQVYVALSRCRTLEGVHLKKKVEKRHIFTDWRAAKFISGCHYRKSEEKMPLENKIALLRKAAEEKRKVRIIYLKTDGSRSVRDILPREVGEMEYSEKRYLAVCGYCFLREEERTFRVDRILEIKEAKGK
ncbi:AAA family ATPase [Candidatus Micrarchaeota archaeon]|nr:AAA family ATPase [Candidatus Micrarchaeota archaeon]